MDPKLIAAMVAGVAVVVAAILGRPRRLPDPLSAVSKMVEIWERLPSGDSKDRVLVLLNNEIGRLESAADAEQVSRRNWYGVFWAVVFVAGGCLLGWIFVGAGGWWLVGLVLPAILVLSGVIVFAQNVTKVPRASNGQTLAYQQKKAAKPSTKR